MFRRSLLARYSAPSFIRSRVLFDADGGGSGGGWDGWGQGGDGQGQGNGKDPNAGLTPEQIELQNKTKALKERDEELKALKAEKAKRDADDAENAKKAEEKKLKDKQDYETLETKLKEDITKLTEERDAYKADAEKWGTYRQSQLDELKKAVPQEKQAFVETLLKDRDLDTQLTLLTEYVKDIKGKDFGGGPQGKGSGNWNGNPGNRQVEGDTTIGLLGAMFNK